MIGWGSIKGVSNIKKKNKNLIKIQYFSLMVGVFVILVGAMGFIRSPEITDIVMLLSGFVMVGVSGYKLFI